MQASRVGFSTGNVNGELNELSRRLDFFQEIGANLAELTAVGLDVVSNCQIIEHRVDQLKKVLMNREMEYTIHAPIAINLLDNDHYDLHLRSVYAAIDLAEAISARLIVVHPGRAPREEWDIREQELLDLERSAMREVGQYAEERNILVAFENPSPNEHHFSGRAISYALDPVRLAQMIREVNMDSVTACLDISHAQQGAKLLSLNILEGVSALAPYVKHIHFSDSTGIPSDIIWDNNGERLFMGIGDMHAPPGWGEINFPALADTLWSNRPPSAGLLTTAIELRSNHISHSSKETLRFAKSFTEEIMGTHS